jgi:hypothetical protein
MLTSKPGNRQPTILSSKIRSVTATMPTAANLTLSLRDHMKLCADAPISVLDVTGSLVIGCQLTHWVLGKRFATGPNWKAHRISVSGLHLRWCGFDLADRGQIEQEPDHEPIEALLEVLAPERVGSF